MLNSGNKFICLGRLVKNQENIDCDETAEFINEEKEILVEKRKSKRFPVSFRDSKGILSFDNNGKKCIDLNIIKEILKDNKIFYEIPDGYSVFLVNVLSQEHEDYVYFIDFYECINTNDKLVKEQFIDFIRRNNKIDKLQEEIANYDLIVNKLNKERWIYEEKISKLKKKLEHI